MADEFHLRTALDIINSLSVEGGDVGIHENHQRIHESLQNIVQPFDLQRDEDQPVFTTAVYADSQPILDATAVIVAREDSSLLSNIFPATVSLEENEEKEDGQETVD